MRIEALETTRIAIPFRETYVTARGRLTVRETVLLELRSESGQTGTGEGVPLTLRGGAGGDAVENDLRGPCTAVLAGADLEALAGPEPAAARDAIWAVIRECRRRGVTPPALAALDIALHDLCGKAMRMPLAQVLGASSPVPVRCNATLPAGTPEAVAATALEWRDRGYDSFKLKAGTGMDFEVLQAVREVVGPGAKIRLDANGAWGVEEAATELARMQILGVHFAEQPVNSLEEMAALRSRTHVPLAADESVNNAAQAQLAAEMRACDLATVKLSKVGGICAALEVAAILPVYMSSALDGPIGIAAAAAVAAVLPDGGPWKGIAHGLATERLFRDWPAADAPRLRGSRIEFADRPGHGAELDRSAIARLKR